MDSSSSTGSTHPPRRQARAALRWLPAAACWLLLVLAFAPPADHAIAQQSGESGTGSEEDGQQEEQQGQDKKEKAKEGKAEDGKAEDDKAANGKTKKDKKKDAASGSGLFTDFDSGDSEDPETGAEADTGNGENADAAADAPALTRRPRPQTAEQERTWKLNRTREDPFLNPPGGELGQGMEENESLYRPSDWLRRELPQDHSVYIVQDKKGQLLGSLSLGIQLRSGEDGEQLVVLSRTTDYGVPSRTEVLSTLDGLRPQLIQREPLVAKSTLLRAAEAPAQEEGDVVDSGPLPEPSLRVDYFYDRVTIVFDDGDVASHAHMRALPYSFDVQQLPLIMRLLDYGAKQWPFEAYITLPENKQSATLVVSGAKLQNQLSAEGEKVTCNYVSAQLGAAKWEWWVQKNAPHRLIRFSDGELTYTLSEYSRSERGGY